MKAILDAQDLPPINITSTPKRFLRFRLVSEDRKVFSQWSTIEMIEPPTHEIFMIDGATAGGPIKVVFDATSNSIIWGPNYFTAAIKVAGGSQLTVGSGHNLRLNDEILIIEYPQFSKRNDGVYNIIGPLDQNNDFIETDYIVIDMTPADPTAWPDLAEGESLDFVTQIPASSIDIYARCRASTIPNYQKIVTAQKVSGSVVLPLTFFPDKSLEPTVDIEIILQHSTYPARVYTDNINSGICPVVLAKAILPVWKVITRL